MNWAGLEVWLLRSAVFEDEPVGYPLASVWQDLLLLHRLFVDLVGEPRPEDVEFEPPYAAVVGLMGQELSLVGLLELPALIVPVVLELQWLDERQAVESYSVLLGLVRHETFVVD